ncbi:MAG: hypothetical protein Q7T25_00360 [Sideroxyarcus sp.]|nr:hypothetical protein [Sideroxyarcus sp.]
MTWGMIGGAAIAVVGGAINAKSGKDAAKSANAQQQAAIDAAGMDPRAEAMIYGDGTDANTGLLAQFQALGQTPQSPGLLGYGQGSDAYLGANGAADMQGMRSAATGLMGSSLLAPTMQAAQMGISHMQPTQAAGGPAVQAFGAPVLWNAGEKYGAPDAMQAAQMGAPEQVSGATVNQPQGMQAFLAGAAQVNAPSQNGMDLSGSYDRLINGDAGANPYLTKALQGGVDQSQQAFSRMQDDSTRNLMESILPSLRSSAIVAGQYGGSRQGIAEGRALGDFGREQQRAIENFGNNNTAATVGAQAGAFSQGQDRALSATQGLGAQQYGVASQDAAMQQQAALSNAAASNAASQTNYQGMLSGAMADAGYGQQAALANQGANLNASSTNAGLSQDASKTNYSGQLGVNAGNAGLAQQANIGNQNAGNAASMFNAGQQQTASSQNATMGQQNNQFNAGTLNSASQFNAGQNQNASQINAGLLQQANGNNQQAQMGTNSLNSANQLAGIGASGGLLAQTAATAQGQDNYDLNRAVQTNSLLAPLLRNQPNVPVMQPYSSNTAGNFLGGAMGGLALYNQFNQLGGSRSTYDGMNTANNYAGPSTTMPINHGALQDMGWFSTPPPRVG